jgi:NAD(P)-dependent dehydrogenase (short-subunit alcohol dehydrogenase family)
MLDSNHLQGKVAIITGAAGAIGAATARLMAARGAKIVAVDRDATALDALTGSLPASAESIGISADVTSEQAVESYVSSTRARFGRIDDFFNNAGIEGAIGPIANYRLEDFQKVMSVNVIGVFLGLKHVLPVMVAQNNGSIINTSSLAGLTGGPGMIAYYTSKHAVIELTRTAALECASTGVRVYCVNPCIIESRMLRDIEESYAPGQSKAVHAQILATIPVGRYGQPDEVATLVAFLASDDSRYISGSIHL